MTNRKRLGFIFPIRPVLVLGIGVFVALVQVANQYLYHLTAGYDYSFSFGAIAVKSLINNLVWVAIVPLIYRLAKRNSTISSPFRKSVLIDFILLFLFPLVHKSLVLFLYNHAFAFQSGYVRSFFGSNNMTELAGGYFLSLVEMIVIFAVLIAVDFQKRLVNKEKDLVKAQLRALKMQLQPHFLFNTLHSISSMIDIDAKLAQRMITRVGDLFRAVLEKDEEDLIPLSEELNFIQNYLELELIRFQDRLKLEFDIETDGHELVPSMILQPVVENSIKYGVSKQSSDSYITVNIKCQPNKEGINMLMMRVRNGSSTPLIIPSKNGFGIGLNNLESRLSQHYNNQFECTFGMVDERTYETKMLIPLRYD